jgi:hypothetical protein
MTEWRRVKDSNVEVCEDGRVRRNGKEVTLSPKAGDRYDICIKGKSYSVHRLIAEAFITKPDGKDVVIHINSNGLDNRSSNLKWVDRDEVDCSSASMVSVVQPPGLPDGIYKLKSGKYEAHVWRDENLFKSFPYKTVEKAMAAGLTMMKKSEL